jgi:hypothetical protein
LVTIPSFLYFTMLSLCLTINYLIMLSQITTLKNDFVIVSFLSSLSVYALYMLITRYLLFVYRSKDSTKPYHYRMFRLYNEKIISNTSSRTEKQFYIAANKVTRTFNFMLIATALMFVMACFF